jgi:putative membrane protein
VWDTQWDMFTALVGAITAQILLGSRHDRALAAVPVAASRPRNEERGHFPGTFGG